MEKKGKKWEKLENPCACCFLFPRKPKSIDRWDEKFTTDRPGMQKKPAGPLGLRKNTSLGFHGSHPNLRNHWVRKWSMG